MEYTQIACDQDVVPFLGKVVSVKSTSYYFTGDKGEVFACVDDTPSYWSGSEIGPNLRVLYAPKECPGNCALVKSLYSEKPVYLRLATDEKIVQLRAQVDAGELRFGYEKGIPKRFPLHPEYDPSSERSMERYCGNVLIKLRPFSMNVEYEYY